MTSELKVIQLYCPDCNSTAWVEVDLSKVGDSGVLQNSIVHEDHVLTFEIDRNGSVRSIKPIKIFKNYIEILSDDVAQYFLNESEKGERWVKIDVYTTNDLFIEFFINILSRTLKLSLKNRGEDNVTLASMASKEKILVRAAHFDVLIGQEIRSEMSGLPEDTMKGLILDINDAKADKLVLEDIIKSQDWVVLLVPKDNREPYFNAISSLCNQLGIPYFIDSLSNENLRKMFDFIHAMFQSG